MIYLLIVHLTYSSADQLGAHWKQMYPNYNINIVDSKEMAADSLDGKLPTAPQGIILLTDSDHGQRFLQEIFPTCPMIGWLCADGQAESLMACSHLIMDPEALSPGYLDALYHHHYHLPLLIAKKDSFYIRELCMEDFPSLDRLQSENESHPDGCFFPTKLTREDRKTFLQDYIRHQYPFFGYGLYAILTEEGCAGIAGFSSMTEFQDYLPVSYALLKEYQGKGLARQAVSALCSYAFDELDAEGIYTKIDKKNKPSIQLMAACGFTLWQEKEDYLYWVKK